MLRWRLCGVVHGNERRSAVICQASCGVEMNSRRGTPPPLDAGQFPLRRLNLEAKWGIKGRGLEQEPSVAPLLHPSTWANLAAVHEYIKWNQVLARVRAYEIKITYLFFVTITIFRCVVTIVFPSLYTPDLFFSQFFCSLNTINAIQSHHLNILEHFIKCPSSW